MKKLLLIALIAMPSSALAHSFDCYDIIAPKVKSVSPLALKPKPKSYLTSSPVHKRWIRLYTPTIVNERACGPDKPIDILITTIDAIPTVPDLPLVETNNGLTWIDTPMYPPASPTTFEPHTLIPAYQPSGRPPVVIEPPVVTPTGAIPEPSTWALLILGFCGLGLILRKKRNERSTYAP